MKCNLPAGKPMLSDVALRVPLLESLYRDRIPPTSANLRCRWAEMVAEYEQFTGKSPFQKKITIQTLVKLYAGKPDTLVIMDRNMEANMSPNGNSLGIRLLNGLTLKVGQTASPELTSREAQPNTKLRDEPEMFLAGF